MAANGGDLPCDGAGVCMVCKTTPSESETLTCKTCATPWHATCLSTPIQTLADAVHWDCPDCSLAPDSRPERAPEASGTGLVAAIRAIEADETMTDREKASRRQKLLEGGAAAAADNDSAGGGNGVMELLDGEMSCSFCMQLPERPVTTPCGHNFCLKCFQKWIGQGKHTCAVCRRKIPPQMAHRPRINLALVGVIRMAKMSECNNVGGPPKASHYVQNQNRPDKCYTTERAKYAGKANACSGKIFVTVQPDHFGPILAENDPERNQGVLVGETWEDRMECKQWGAHRTHISGIAGQSKYGAQSVALSGGYEDDEDHGEWFLYTGSGGRDLKGNKRTNKTHSSDQEFAKSNKALQESCRQGYPVRVVRSFKDKRSSYAPETGVRYDGIYRVEKCWLKPGIQGFMVCRYLFVRCDNAPAPWTSDEQGDRPRPLPCIKEYKDATDMIERKIAPSWDYDEEKSCWMWKKPPPASKKPTGNNGKISKSRRNKRAPTIQKKLLKEFSCLICRKVLSQPLTTPCAHNFCKACLEGKFAGKTYIRRTNCEGRRSLRARKNIMKCPSCPNDISDFLQNPQVNREMMGMIESLLQQTLEAETKESSEEVNAADEKCNSVCAEYNDVEDGEVDNAQNDDVREKDDQNSPSKIVPVVTDKCKKAGGGDLVKTDGQDEDGNKGNRDSSTKIAAARKATSKCKIASGDSLEKGEPVINEIKTKVAAKRKTSPVAKEDPKVAVVNGEGKRSTKRLKATQ